MNKPPKPPADLGEDGEALWREIIAGWDVTPDAEAILESACRFWQRYKDAEREITKTGLLVKNRYNCWIANPACDLARRSHIQFLAAMKALGLETEASEEARLRPRNRVGRPPKGGRY